MFTFQFFNLWDCDFLVNFVFALDKKIESGYISINIPRHLYLQRTGGIGYTGRLLDVDDVEIDAADG